MMMMAAMITPATVIAVPANGIDHATRKQRRESQRDNDLNCFHTFLLL